jgi:segregation and condensation protein B
MIELKPVIEALLFASQKPLTLADLKAVLANAADQSEEPGVRAFKKVKVDDLAAALDLLRQEHEAAGRAWRLACVADAWQFVALPEFAPWLRVLSGERARPAKLSQPALETLTIIAYRQPITRAEIEQIRGVSVDGVMQTLLDRGLVETTGRAEVVGRPMTYGTTRAFLEYFGLAALDDLPGGDELRRIPVERPPSLLTVEPGLATVPSDQLAGPAGAPPEPTGDAPVPEPATPPPSPGPPGA